MKALPSFVRIDDVLINFGLVARIEITATSPEAAAHATFWSTEGSLIFTWMPVGINKAGIIKALDEAGSHSIIATRDLGDRLAKQVFTLEEWRQMSE